MATPGTARDIAKPSVEAQVVEQKITTPKAPAPAPTPAPTPAPQQFPTGTQGLRATAEGYGLPVGFDATTGQVSIGGKAVDVSGLQRDAQGSYFGTPEQIRSIINQAGTPPSGYTSLREAFAGSDVQWTPQTGVTIDGVQVDTSRLPIVGDRYYIKPEDAAALAQQVQAQKEAAMTPEERFQEQITVTNEELQRQQEELNRQRQELMTGLREYTSPLQEELTTTLRSIYGNPFQYDPNADQSLRQAQSYAEKQLMEQLNARGILSSTITRDQYASLLSELIPKYESIAFERYNQNIDGLLKKANVLTQLSQDDYQRYRDFVVQSINTIDEVNKNTISAAKNNLDSINDALKMQLQREKDAFDMNLKMIEGAYKKLDAQGFVDNEIAAITGLAVNTPSQEVRRSLLQQKIAVEKAILDTELKIQEQNNKAKLDKEQVDYEYELKAPERELAAAKFEEQKRATRVSEGLRSRAQTTAEANLALRVREIEDKAGAKKNLTYTEIDRTLGDLIDAYTESEIPSISDFSWTKPGSVEAKELSEFIEERSGNLDVTQAYALYKKYNIPIPGEAR